MIGKVNVSVFRWKKIAKTKVKGFDFEVESQVQANDDDDDDVRLVPASEQMFNR